jgi:hypothetical protein
MTTTASQPNLTVRIEPTDMVRYVQTLMITPRDARAEDSSKVVAQRQWGSDSPLAQAAELRWNALSRAFGDERVSSWTGNRRRDQIYVPAALIAAAGVARLKVEADGVVFDIPTLLDATLELAEPVGHA